MKERLLYQWNFARVIRLVLGIMVLIQGFTLKQYFLGSIGGIIALLALLGYSACGAAGCAPNIHNDHSKKSVGRIDYEELDDKK